MSLEEQLSVDPARFDDWEVMVRKLGFGQPIYHASGPTNAIKRLSKLPPPIELYVGYWSAFDSSYATIYQVVRKRYAESERVWSFIYGQLGNLNAGSYLNSAMHISGATTIFGQQRLLDGTVYKDMPENEFDKITHMFSGVGLWWITREEIVVCDRPRVLAYDPVREELHREDGPAVLWDDGTSLYSWHGRIVPSWIIEETFDVHQALNEENVELRRCALEKLGWESVIDSIGTLIRSVPDPGNNDQMLKLWKCEGLRDYGLLECTNASLERDGTRRRYILSVPHRFVNPVAAAAWTFRLTTKEYAELARAT